MSLIRSILLGAGVLACSQALAANWPHWRGEQGNGVSTTAQPPLEWSTTKNVKWKVAVEGRGSGSPIVWEDRLYVVTAVESPDQPGGNQRGRQLPKLQFKLICFDRGSGQRQWECTAVEAVPHQGVHATHGFASASPCTDGEHVYAHFGSRGLFCFTLDGELVWKREFGKMTTRSNFGEGSSPRLVDDAIIVPWDHEGQSYLYCLNKRSGETIWQVQRDEPSCWCTPLVIEHNAQKQIIMNGQTCARAYDMKTGEELWRCGGQTTRPVASAVAGDGLVYVGSGFQGSFLAAFRPGGRGDIEGTDHVVWTITRDTPDIGSPLLTGSRIYFYKGKSGLLSCVDAATGKPHYTAQRVGLGNTYASPIAANGYVYLFDRNGKTVVIKDAPELSIVAENEIGEAIDATPAPVDRELFIRGEQHLYCIAE